MIWASLWNCYTNNNYRNNINRRDPAENLRSHDVWWVSFLLAVVWVFCVLADKQQSSRSAEWERLPFGSDSNIIDRWNDWLGTNIKCWNLIIQNSLAMHLLSLLPRTQPALCPLPMATNCSHVGSMTTGSMLWMAISAGALFAYVFAFSLGIVQDSSSKSKSCYISYVKSAASSGFLLMGKCSFKFCFFLTAVEV